MIWLSITLIFIYVCEANLLMCCCFLLQMIIFCSIQFNYLKINADIVYILRCGTVHKDSTAVSAH